ncbi:tripartite tricarboxylate transporter substrate binding protein [Alkalihalobacillus sp. BA299]|uniref:tripartite tricarboxylate transporter substrate binding protein n=1 Tax=Alkalihalobacillus sp. BA299 TaxID=2815938 RepID=UPI001ADA0BF5|nr:tripartite tricarboxylate transporter substrate-binding protein [Alkalihalobacillus sp. BA299]
MKKLFSLIVILSLLFVVAACSSQQESSSNGGGSNESEKSSEKASFPTDNIEIVAPASPGGGWDGTARAIQKILKDENIITENMNVVNKPGGGGEVGWQYLSKQDAHHLAINSSLVLTNNLLGKSKLTYNDFTPIAILTSEWIGTVVPKDSQFETGAEIMEALKADPTSLKIGLAPALGNNDHLSFVQAAKTYGVDVTKLNFMIYESGGDIVTALLGGHIDFATTGVSEVVEQHQSGNLKIVAVTSEERMEEIPDVATWTEQGVDMVFPHWRGIMGPPNMAEGEIAYWDEKISAMVETDAWKTLLKNNGWSSYYKSSSETVEFLNQQNQNYDTLLSESGLIE